MQKLAKLQILFPKINQSWLSGCSPPPQQFNPGFGIVKKKLTLKWVNIKKKVKQKSIGKIESPKKLNTLDFFLKWFTSPSQKYISMKVVN